MMTRAEHLEQLVRELIEAGETLTNDVPPWVRNTPDSRPT